MFQYSLESFPRQFRKRTKKDRYCFEIVLMKSGNGFEISYVLFRHNFETGFFLQHCINSIFKPCVETISHRFEQQ